MSWNHTALPFDHVVIRTDGSRTRMTLEAFFELPLHVRVQHMLARELQFLRGDRLVDIDIALRALRTARVA